MSITTKRGDEGNTTLCKGCKQPKCAAKISAIGDIDELISLVGLCIVYDGYTYTYLEEIQSELSTVCAELARANGVLITKNHVNKIDHYVDHVNAVVTIPNKWFYGGADKRASYLNFARAVARRCERSVVKLKEDGFDVNPNILVYLNRLSDLLYLLIFVKEEKQCPKL